jgi:hypothetical protein
VAQRLTSTLLVIALLFQAIASVPAALAACAGRDASATVAHECSGDAATPSDGCACCVPGVAHTVCAGTCAALAMPVDAALSVVSPRPVIVPPLVAVLVRGLSYAPPDPPPIV